MALPKDTNETTFSAEDYFSREKSDHKLNQYEEAIANYTRATKLFNPSTHPNDLADAFRKRGNSYFDLNQYEEAIADYTRAIELFNLNAHKNELAKAFLKRGNSYDEFNQYEKAFADYREKRTINGLLLSTYKETAPWRY